MKKYGLLVVSSLCIGNGVIGKAIQYDASPKPLLVDSEPMQGAQATIIDTPGLFTSSGDTIRGLYMYACYQHRKGDAQKAYDIYQKIFSYTLTSEQNYVYDGYIRLLFETSQFARVVSLVKDKKDIVAKMLAKDVQLRLFYAQSCLYAGNQEQADREFASLAKEHKDNEAVAYYMAESMMKSGKTDQALVFVEECLANNALKRKHFFFHFIASKIYHKKNQLAQALVEIDKSISMFPRFGQGLLFKAMLCEQQNNIDEAVKSFSMYLDLVGPDPEIEKHMVQLLLGQRRFADAADRLRKNAKTEATYHFDLALLELHAKRPENALKDIKRCLKQQPDFARARLLKLDILLTLRKVSEALNLVQRWLINEPQNLSVVNVLMLMKKAKVPHDQLAQTIEKVLEQKQSLLLHAALADLSFEATAYDKAQEHYTKALAFAVDDSMRIKLTYQQAYTMVKLNQHKQAKKLLKPLAEQEAYPAACNLLAYLYAKEENHLPQALILVDKALRKDPKRAAFYDTKGYILAKMGRKEEASFELKKALTYKPHSNRIRKHVDALELK